MALADFENTFQLKIVGDTTTKRVIVALAFLVLLSL